MKLSAEERLSLHRVLASSAVVKGSNSMQKWAVCTLTYSLWHYKGMAAFTGPEQTEVNVVELVP